MFSYRRTLSFLILTGLMAVLPVSSAFPGEKAETPAELESIQVEQAPALVSPPATVKKTVIRVAGSMPPVGTKIEEVHHECVPAPVGVPAPPETSFWRKILPLAARVPVSAAAVGGSIVYIVSGATQNFELLNQGAALFDASFGADFLLNARNDWERFRADPASIQGVCIAADNIGKLVCIGGFGILSTGNNIEVGSWLATSGFALRSLVTGALVATQGMTKTFGNSNHVRNAISKIVALSVVATTGGFLMSTNFTRPGSLIIGPAATIGNADVMIGYIEAINKIYQHHKPASPDAPAADPVAPSPSQATPPVEEQKS